MEHGRIRRGKRKLGEVLGAGARPGQLGRDLAQRLAQCIRRIVVARATRQHDLSGGGCIRRKHGLIAALSGCRHRAWNP